MAQQAVRPAEIGEQAVERIEQQQWLDRVGSVLDRAITTAVERAGSAGRTVKNFLHGTWLGHPLHPVITDIPVGAWTAALVMDLRDSDGAGRRLRPGADAAIGVGIVGAAAAALPGLMDWHHTSGGSRRVGVVHGMLNTAVLGVYGTSLLLRRAGHRDAGRALSYVGYAALLVSAYLGGTLVYRQRIGVDHAQRPDRPGRFVPVMRDGELPEGGHRRADVEGQRLLLVRRGGRIQALGEVCAHLGGPLAEGVVDAEGVTCPWHGSRFSVEDGRVLDGPATAPVPVFEARVRDGMIEVRV